MISKSHVSKEFEEIETLRQHGVSVEFERIETYVSMKFEGMLTLTI
jgi:hypothetical protein